MIQMLSVSVLYLTFTLRQSGQDWDGTIPPMQTFLQIAVGGFLALQTRGLMNVYTGAILLYTNIQYT
jgi:hypothetical protein